MRRHTPEQYRSHPTLFQAIGQDNLVQLGLYKPQMDFVVVEAIDVEAMSLEVAQRDANPLVESPNDEKRLLLRGDRDRMSETTSFKIVGYGPVVKRVKGEDRSPILRLLAFLLGWLFPGLIGRSAVAGVTHYPANSLPHIKVGNHCHHLAASADAFEADDIKTGRYYQVQACFVSACLDPAEARERVAAAQEEADRLRAEREAREAESSKFIKDERRSLVEARA